jgi:hypothetical protein
MKILLLICFILAFCGTTWFFGRLLTWHALKISPQNFKKDFTDRMVLITNIVMYISISLWGVIFYNLI